MALHSAAPPEEGSKAALGADALVSTSAPSKTLSIPDIEAMSRSQMCALWRQWMKRDVPAKISQPMLRKLLANEAQIRQYGGLNRTSKAALAKVYKEIDAPSAAIKKTTAKLQPGAQLLREWNSVTHRVDVTEHGFVWQDQTYTSLSAIARAITGAHWSGPRFFGLTATGGKNANR